MARRFQFSLKWLFVAMLAVACFFGGIRFERERQRRADLANRTTTEVVADRFRVTNVEFVPQE